jgi:hypothetical protein
MRLIEPSAEIKIAPQIASKGSASESFLNIVLIPPLAEKLGISLSGKFKALIVLGCFLGAGIAMTSAPKKVVSPPATKKAASEVSPKPEAPRTDIAKPIETEKPLPPIAGNAAISEASKTPSKKTALSEISRLYLELQNFKNDPQFHRFGFAPGHKYRNWQLETKRLIDSTPRDVGMEVMREGVVPGDLLMLGSEYLTSKGKETEYTRYINAQFQQALKMK